MKTLILLSSLLLSLNALATVKIQLLDKDGAPVDGVAIAADVTGSKVTWGGDSGVPMPGRHRYSLESGNYLTDHDGMVKSEGHDDFKKFYGLSAKVESISFSPSLICQHASGSMGMPYGYYMNEDVFKCARISGDAAVEVQWSSITMPWKQSKDASVVCKAIKLTASEIKEKFEKNKTECEGMYGSDLNWK